MDCSPPGSSVHGILQARILEWVAISFSRGSSSPRDWARHVSCIGWWFLLLLNHLESTKTAAQEGLGLWIWILDCKPGLGGTIPSLNLFISSSPPTLQRRVWSPFIKPPREDFLKKKKKDLFIWLHWYQLWHVGSSIFVAAGRIFSWGRWDLISWPQREPNLLHWECKVHQGRPQERISAWGSQCWCLWENAEPATPTYTHLPSTLKSNWQEAERHL